MKQQATKVDTFPDKNLERAVRKAIGKPTGPIYVADLEKLTKLDAGLESITDLTGLEYCTDLEKLDLRTNPISDIKPLISNSGLSEGDVVYLGGNNPLSSTSIKVYIPQLRERGVCVSYY
jgi:Leucine-rich repeat (LRR) protein